MSKTMSNPNDWSHFYHHHTHNQLNFSSSSTATGGGGSSPSVAAVTTTSTVTSSSADPAPIHLPGSGRGGHTLSPEGGRVAKPARRRSRASRRTPTTLLNTDTSNFRAMVQQFTGGPAGPFMNSGASGSSSSLNAPPPAGFGFGLGNPNVGLGQQHHQLLLGDRVPNASAAAPPAGEGLFHHLQYQQQQFHQQSPFMFALGNASGGEDPADVEGINGDLLLQREGGGGAAAPPSSAGGNENRNSSGFLY